VLGRRFRETFIRLLNRSYKSGSIVLCGKTAPLAESWQSFVDSLRNHEWVVYAKPPSGGPKQVLKYLANYTHRVAISNRRIVAVGDDHVRFLWNDYRGSRRKTMTLEATEFIRRFLMHVLPNGFVRIRHFGFLANRVRRAKLDRVRTLLKAPTMPDAIEVMTRSGSNAGVVIQLDDAEGTADPPCLHCKKGRLRVIEMIPPDGNIPLRPG